MEFERAIFRVYERSVEAFIYEEDPARTEEPVYSKSCQLCEWFLLLLGISITVCLGALHTNFVGRTGCLPGELMFYNASLNASSPYVLQKDDILGINIRDQRKPISPGFFTDDGKTTLEEEETVGVWKTAKYASHMVFSTYSLIGKYGRSMPSKKRQYLKSSTMNYPAFNGLATNSSSAASNSSTDNSQSVSDLAFNFDYIVTFDEGITLMEPSMLRKHDFNVMNVTLYGTECFGGSTLDTLLRSTASFDIAVLNNVMFTSHMPGYLLDNEGLLYRWTASDYIEKRSAGEWIAWKLGMVVCSLLAFFLLSTTTAMLVRVLISSGVIMIFPMFWCLRFCGVGPISMRVVALSYPWIGQPLQAIIHNRDSIYPFIFAHITRVVIYYLLYIAAQAVYIDWLYNDVTFGADQLWLYAVMMIWEYYSMIYLRSALSIELFPKASLSLFLLFHFYYYSYPSGFHSLALTAMFCFLLALMSYCVRVFEVKAYRRGLVNFDQPRMLYGSLPWPVWRADLAPDYTLFMPVTQRSTSVYSDTVPARPNDPAATATTGPQEPGSGSGTSLRRRAREREAPAANERRVQSVSGYVEMQSLASSLRGAFDRNSTSLNNSNTPENQRNLGENNGNRGGEDRSSGVTSFFARFFAPANYQSINSTSMHESMNRTDASIGAPRETVRQHNLSPSSNNNNSNSSFDVTSALHQEQQV